jgi:hypothetical protein
MAYGTPTYKISGITTIPDYAQYAAQKMNHCITYSLAAMPQQPKSGRALSSPTKPH